MNNSSKPATNMFNAIAKNAQATTTRAANQISNTIGNAATTTMAAVTNVAKNIPVVNSLLPLTNTGSNKGPMNSVVKAVNSATNTAVNAATNAANAALNAANNTFKNIIPSAANSAATGWSMPWWGWPVIVFIVFAGIATTLFVVYSKEISDGIGAMFGWTKPAAAPSPEPAPEAEAPAAPASESSLLSKLLPSGSPAKEVFNVSSNEFTYYDAEPMCRALGAELATYDQVMDAWKKGADWCNYGWVKGQNAVYPTQKETFEKLQGGPEEDQKACGNPGVNGGFFDNPEMRFGVNCYGVKPSQTANDQRMLEERGTLPRSTATLKIDQQAQEYKDRLASIGVLPFNEDTWSSA